MNERQATSIGGLVGAVITVLVLFIALCSLLSGSHNELLQAVTKVGPAPGGGYHICTTEFPLGKNYGDKDTETTVTQDIQPGFEETALLCHAHGKIQSIEFHFRPGHNLK